MSVGFVLELLQGGGMLLTHIFIFSHFFSPFFTGLLGGSIWFVMGGGDMILTHIFIFPQKFLPFFTGVLGGSVGFVLGLLGGGGIIVALPIFLYVFEEVCFRIIASQKSHGHCYVHRERERERERMLSGCL